MISDAGGEVVADHPHADALFQFVGDPPGEADQKNLVRLFHEQAAHLEVAGGGVLGGGELPALAVVRAGGVHPLKPEAVDVIEAEGAQVGTRKPPMFFSAYSLTWPRVKTPSSPNAAASAGRPRPRCQGRSK